MKSDHLRLISELLDNLEMKFSKDVFPPVLDIICLMWIDDKFVSMSNKRS